MATDTSVRSIVAAAPPQSENFPEIDSEEVEPHFRAIGGRGGERRGIRLERIYWDGLNRVSREFKMSTADIVQRAADQVSESANLTSMLRVISFKWALRRLETVEDRVSQANLNAIVQASPSPTLVVTRERKIQLFNDPFLAMLRTRLSLSDPALLARGLRFLIDTQVDEALDALNTNKGKIIKTGFGISINGQTMRGRINIALAPAYEKSMLIGYVSSY